MASGNDLNAHGATYTGFIGLVKWTIPIVVLITVFVILLIS